MTDLKVLFRAARRLQDAWQARAAKVNADARHLLDQVTVAQEELNEARSRFETARCFGLELVLPELWNTVLAYADNLRRTSARVQQRVDEAVPAPSVQHLLEELRQLEDEFGHLKIDLRLKTLSVTTESIALEHVHLGPFAICLRWLTFKQMEAVDCFEIVAEEPNPASANPSVTHPHVRDRKLCAGEATMPLRLAMDQGRLADAFCLIQSVLTHYNAGSAYARLDEWGGPECYDCGTVMSRSEIWRCDRCDHAVCPGCRGDCSACNCVCCGECLRRCPLCEDPFCDECLMPSPASGKECCPRCLRQCAECGALVARDELTKDTKCCPACLKRTSAPTSPEDHESNSSETCDANREFTAVAG